MAVKRPGPVRTGRLGLDGKITVPPAHRAGNGTLGREFPSCVEEALSRVASSHCEGAWNDARLSRSIPVDSPHFIVGLIPSAQAAKADPDPDCHSYSQVGLLADALT